MEIEDTKSFFENLRDSNKVQHDTQVNLLNQQRDLQQANIMSEANRAGMAYSNFPQRSMLQYDVNTYNPNLVKLNTSYQTGLNTLRNQGTQLMNNILNTQRAIRLLNEDIRTTL